MKGYKLLTTIVGEWELICYEKGLPKSYFEYAKYHIYYNSKKDKYNIEAKGLKNKLHPTYTNLCKIIETINNHSEPAVYLGTPVDFFTRWEKLQQEQEKETIEDFFFDFKQDETLNPNKPEPYKILKIPLDNYQSHLEQIRIKDKRLIEGIQKYKKEFLDKNPTIDIWEELDNVVVTSEGCYFTMYDSQIILEDDEKNEDIQ